jgi:hypothetical protein
MRKTIYFWNNLYGFKIKTEIFNSIFYYFNFQFDSFVKKKLLNFRVRSFIIVAKCKAPIFVNWKLMIWNFNPSAHIFQPTKKKMFHIILSLKTNTVIPDLVAPILTIWTLVN